MPNVSVINGERVIPVMVDYEDYHSIHLVPEDWWFANQDKMDDPCDPMGEAFVGTPEIQEEIKNFPTLDMTFMYNDDYEPEEENNQEEESEEAGE